MKRALRTLVCVSAACFAAFSFGCTKSKSKPNDITLGNLVVDDAFVSQATSAIIAGSLSKGCSDFGFDEANQTRCADAFLRLTELLDFKAATNGDQSGFVFLHAELLNTINSQTGKAYLTALYQKISETYSTNQALQLWNFTLDYFKGDTKATITHIASLFQDTMPTQAQIKWLYSTNEGDGAQLQGILMDLDYLGKNKLINFYPPGVESTREALYHFYIPMYFASKMKFHYTKKDMAFLTALLFNARYEFRQIWETSHPQDKVNYNVTGGIARRKALVQDLIVHLEGPILPFDATKEPGNFEDLYLGYAGATMGINGTFSKIQSDDFRKNFAANPLPFIKTALATMK